MKRLDYSLIPKKYHAEASKIESLLRSFGFDVELTKDQAGALRVAKGCKSIYFKFSGNSNIDHFVYETLLFESSSESIDEFLNSGKLSSEVINGALNAKAELNFLQEELGIGPKDDFLDSIEYFDLDGRN